MKQFFTFATLLFLPTTILYGQNLIRNPGFESHKEFPDGLSSFEWRTFYYLNGWKSTGHVMIDLCDTLLEKRKDKIFKKTSCCGNTINPHQGKCMVKISYSEACGPVVPSQGCATYLKTKLVTPLNVGDVYEISMWVYFPGHQMEDPSIYNNIGFHLSLDPQYVETHDLLDEDYFFGDSIPLNTWHEIKHYIRALCPLQYLIIGSFRNKDFPKLHRNIDNDVVYFIDDVSIYKLNDETLPKTIEPTPFCNYFVKRKQEQDQSKVESINIYFESNDYLLDEQDKANLKNFVSRKSDTIDRAFIISGHTDNEGDDNLLLSRNRANAVKEFIHNEFQFPDHMIISFGKGIDSLGDNKLESGKQLNRRVTIQYSNISSTQAIYRKGLSHFQKNEVSQAAQTFKQWLNSVSLDLKIQLLHDPRLASLKQQPVWQFIVKEVRTAYRFYKHPGNSFFLDSMYFVDQFYRMYTPSYLSGSIPGLDSCIFCESRPSLKEFKKNDSLNLKELEKYLEANSFPKISGVGPRQVKAAGYILIHSEDTTVLKKYLPEIEANCMSGEGEWELFMMMSDRLQLLRQQPQLYGTQSIYSATEKSWKLYTVDNIEKVNIRRRRFGLHMLALPQPSP